MIINLNSYKKRKHLKNLKARLENNPELQFYLMAGLTALLIILLILGHFLKLYTLS